MNLEYTKKSWKPQEKNNPTEKDTEFSRHIDKGIENSNIEKIANTAWANVD